MLALQGRHGLLPLLLRKRCQHLRARLHSDVTVTARRPLGVRCNWEHELHCCKLLPAEGQVLQQKETCVSCATRWSHRGILGLALQIGFAFLICWASWHCQQPGKMEGRMQHSPLQVPAPAITQQLSVSRAHNSNTIWKFGMSLQQARQAWHTAEAVACLMTCT